MKQVTTVVNTPYIWTPSKTILRVPDRRWDELGWPIEASYSLINSTFKAAESTTTVTTDEISTVGANLLTAQIAWSFVSSAKNLSDSSTNTWVALTEQDEGSGSETGFVIYYCFNPTTSATHTFTSTSDYAVLAVQAWSGSNGFDTGKQNGTTGIGTSIAPGSVTPSEANCLFIAGCALGDVVTVTSPGAPYTQLVNTPLVGGLNYGLTVVYEIQSGGPTARNPGFTASVGAPWACASASFKGPGGTKGANHFNIGPKTFTSPKRRYY